MSAIAALTSLPAKPDVQQLAQLHAALQQELPGANSVAMSAESTRSHGALVMAVLKGLAPRISASPDPTAAALLADMVSHALNTLDLLRVHMKAKGLELDAQRYNCVRRMLLAGCKAQALDQGLRLHASLATRCSGIQGALPQDLKDMLLACRLNLVLSMGEMVPELRATPTQAQTCLSTMLPILTALLEQLRAKEKGEEGEEDVTATLAVARLAPSSLPWQKQAHQQQQQQQQQQQRPVHCRAEAVPDGRKHAESSFKCLFKLQGLAGQSGAELGLRVALLQLFFNSAEMVEQASKLPQYIPRIAADLPLSAVTSLLEAVLLFTSSGLMQQPVLAVQCVEAGLKAVGDKGADLTAAATLPQWQPCLQSHPTIGPLHLLLQLRAAQQRACATGSVGSSSSSSSSNGSSTRSSRSNGNMASASNGSSTIRGGSERGSVELVGLEACLAAVGCAASPSYLHMAVSGGSAAAASPLDPPAPGEPRLSSNQAAWLGHGWGQDPPQTAADLSHLPPNRMTASAGHQQPTNQEAQQQQQQQQQVGKQEQQQARHQEQEQPPRQQGVTLEQQIACWLALGPVRKVVVEDVQSSHGPSQLSCLLSSSAAQGLAAVLQEAGRLALLLERRLLEGREAHGPELHGMRCEAVVQQGLAASALAFWLLAPCLAPAGAEQQAGSGRQAADTVQLRAVQRQLLGRCRREEECGDLPWLAAVTASAGEVASKAGNPDAALMLGAAADIRLHRLAVLGARAAGPLPADQVVQAEKLCRLHVSSLLKSGSCAAALQAAATHLVLLALAAGPRVRLVRPLLRLHAKTRLQLLTSNSLALPPPSVPATTAWPTTPHTLAQAAAAEPAPAAAALAPVGATLAPAAAEVAKGAVTTQGLKSATDPPPKLSTRHKGRVTAMKAAGIKIQPVLTPAPLPPPAPAPDSLPTQPPE
ncbi:hypothetical protein QJQ45_014091, partial [Haematococcus lacustris]